MRKHLVIVRRKIQTGPKASLGVKQKRKDIQYQENTQLMAHLQDLQMSKMDNIICLLLLYNWECIHILLCFSQTARDIESKMRSEARLKLFTLDPDTQVLSDFSVASL